MFKTALQKKVSHRFFVTPRAGVNFSGVLTKAGKKEHDWSTFVDVKAHLPNANPEPCPGEMFIQNSNIAYMQLMPIEEPVINNVTYLHQIADADD